VANHNDDIEEGLLEYEEDRVEQLRLKEETDAYNAVILHDIAEIRREMELQELLDSLKKAEFYSEGRKAQQTQDTD